MDPNRPPPFPPAGGVPGNHSNPPSLSEQNNWGYGWPARGGAPGHYNNYQAMRNYGQPPPMAYDDGRHGYQLQQQYIQQQQAQQQSFATCQYNQRQAAAAAQPHGRQANAHHGPTAPPPYAAVPSQGMMQPQYPQQPYYTHQQSMQQPPSVTASYYHPSAVAAAMPQQVFTNQMEYSNYRMQGAPDMSQDHPIDAAAPLNQIPNAAAADARSPPRPLRKPQQDWRKNRAQQQLQQHSVTRPQTMQNTSVPRKRKSDTPSTSDPMNPANRNVKSEDKIRWTRHAARLILAAYMEIVDRPDKTGNIDRGGGSESEESVELLRACHTAIRKGDKVPTCRIPEGKEGVEFIKGFDLDKIRDCKPGNGDKPSTAKDKFRDHIERANYNALSNNKRDASKNKHLYLLQRLLSYFLAAYIHVTRGEKGTETFGGNTKIETQQYQGKTADDYLAIAIEKNVIGLFARPVRFPLPDGPTGVKFTEKLHSELSRLSPSS